MRLLYLLPFFVSSFFSAAAQTGGTLADSAQLDKRVFNLGEVRITGRKPGENTAVSRQQIEAFNRLDVSHALNLLPGVNLASVGARNESVVLIRGFDLRQVPVYIDGIPVYVPYDGYVDLGRFTTADVSQISVAKGFSSVTYGANTLGGAINIVSRKPVKPFEVEARTGWLSGQGSRLSLNVGSNLGKVYFQGSASRLKQEGFPLSKDFTPRDNEDGQDRNNAYREDTKYTFKVGFTPRGEDEYAISYVNQQGEKGNPPYVGSDPLQRARFWQWPYWDKESLYFVSSTRIGKNSTLKTRLFYDQFRNLLQAFDDNTYTTQNRPSSFQSFYHDDTYGAAVEYASQWQEKHQLKAALQYKNDQHQEYNLGEPERTFRDYTTSLGVEDTYQVNERLTLLPGISLNLRHSLEAQNYNAATKEITDLPENENYALNAQLGAVYQLTGEQRLTFSLARKSRFATIKDRYSYRMGAAIPNPDLTAESALHYEGGYTGTFKNKWQLETNLFYSRIQDVIQQINNVQPNIFQLQNTGKAAFYGAEFSGSYNIRDDWKAGGQYSYLHRTNLSNKDLKFTDAPAHKVLLFSSYAYQDRGSLLASAEYNSVRYSTSYGIKSPGFTLVNLRAQVKIYRSFSVEGGVNNLFDKNYTLVEGFPEAGRNYFVNLVFSNL